MTGRERTASDATTPIHSGRNSSASAGSSEVVPVSQVYFSPKDVATMTGFKIDAVRRAIAAGELRAYKPRGRVRIHQADVDAWMRGTELETEPQEAAVVPRRPYRRQPAPGGMRALLESEGSEHRRESA